MKYSPEMVKRICDLIESDDYTIAEICKICDISRETFFGWRRENLDFMDALKEAEARRLEQFKKAARSGLMTLLNGKEWDETTVEYEEEEDAENRGQKRLVEKYKKTVRKFSAPNPAAVIFTLKNVDGDNFADTLRSEISGRNGAPLPAPTVILQMPQGIDINLPQNTEGETERDEQGG